MPYIASRFSAKRFSVHLFEDDFKNTVCSPFLQGEQDAQGESKGSRGRGFKDSRIRGFEGSRGKDKERGPRV